MKTCLHCGTGYEEQTPHICAEGSKSDLSPGLIARISEENAKLRDLIRHAWVHAAYEKSGWWHMTSEQKALFDRIAKEEIAKGD